MQPTYPEVSWAPTRCARKKTLIPVGIGGFPVRCNEPDDESEPVNL
jgi:hypothetical protein